MAWFEFQRVADDACGTLIVERLSLKGPFRWWWTPENVYEVCPIPIVHWLDQAPHDE